MLVVGLKGEVLFTSTRTSSVRCWVTASPYHQGSTCALWCAKWPAVSHGCGNECCLNFWVWIFSSCFTLLRHARWKDQRHRSHIWMSSVKELNCKCKLRGKTIKLLKLLQYHYSTCAWLPQISVHHMVTLEFMDWTIDWGQERSKSLKSQMNWLLQYWMHIHIVINCTQCLSTNQKKKNGVIEKY